MTEVSELSHSISLFPSPFLFLSFSARLQLRKYIKLSTALRCHELNAKDSQVGQPQVTAVSLLHSLPYSRCPFSLLSCCICMQFAFVFCSLYSFHLARHFPTPAGTLSKPSSDIICSLYEYIIP